MTNEKFAALCEQILVPRIGDMLHQQLTEFHITHELIARELIRIGARLDKLELLRDHASDE